MEDSTREFWEPGAPDFAERLCALSFAFKKGFSTSVSTEPLLEPWNVEKLVDKLTPWVTDSIWIGKANKIDKRTNWLYPNGHATIEKLKEWQSDEKVKEIYEMFRDNPLIKWKESYKEVLGIESPDEAGLDV